MMDAKEARDLLILESAGAARDRKEIQANAMAILALEHRIPKKPSGDYHSVPHYRCPECKCAVVMYENDSRHPFCKWCGQSGTAGSVFAHRPKKKRTRDAPRRRER